jgi:crossover junction endodeoxyribonuclease RuvC
MDRKGQLMADPLESPNGKISEQARVILGIDPGTVATGWGIVEAAGNSIHHLAHGTIPASNGEGQAVRLSRIYRGLREVIEDYHPCGVSLERVFFAHNAQSALKLGQARGVALLAAAECNVAVYDYASTEIKMAVAGYGHATKEQVQKMVALLLHLSGKIAADAADALAAAICHLHRSTFQSRVSDSIQQGASKLRRRVLA